MALHRRSTEQSLSKVDAFEVIKERYPAFLELLTSRHREIISERAITNIETAELREIIAASRRIADCTYGLCEDCGETISLRRLQAIPYSRLCLDCQSYRERKRAG